MAPMDRSKFPETFGSFRSFTNSWIVLRCSKFRFTLLAGGNGVSLGACACVRMEADIAITIARAINSLLMRLLRVAFPGLASNINVSVGIGVPRERRQQCGAKRQRRPLWPARRV